MLRILFLIIPYGYILIMIILIIVVTIQIKTNSQRDYSLLIATTPITSKLSLTAPSVKLIYVGDAINSPMNQTN